MYVKIDQSRHHITSVCVDHSVCFCVNMLRNLPDPVVLDKHVILSVSFRERVDHMPILNQ